jgi:archaellin
MTTSDQMEIQLNITVVPKDTKINIEIRPGLGAAFPFSKTTPVLITASNVLS